MLYSAVNRKATLTSSITSTARRERITCFRWVQVVKAGQSVVVDGNLWIAGASTSITDSILSLSAWRIKLRSSTVTFEGGVSDMYAEIWKLPKINMTVVKTCLY